MSKMSELHVELSEQAYDLGFNSLDDALNAGYEIDYTESRLVKHECCEQEKEQEKAHQAWLKEKQELLDRAEEMWASPNFDDLLELMKDLVEFIKRGEV